MIFTDLQARATLLASLEGWTDVAIAPAWDVLVNRAWYQYSWDAECVIGTTTVTTAIGTPNYALTGNWKRLLDVVYDTTGTSSPVRHSSEDYERYRRADWRVQTNGVPVRYTFNPFNTLTLVPPPSAIKTASVRGIQQGAPLVLGSDVLPIPDALQEGVCIYAAYLQGKAYSQGEASARLQTYLADYSKYVEDGKDYASLVAGGN